MSGDGCSAMCTREIARCGDGRMDIGEQCDDGNLGDCDGCSRFCTSERCGNTILECMEECDDGNTRSGDGCSAMCTIEMPRCGDGRITVGEECDDSNATDCDGCSSACLLEACGNRRLECMEECDDGNLRNGDGCSNMCRIEIPPRCGDGTVNAGEECDDSNTTDCDGCSSACLREACGNGRAECMEACDDGNTMSGDGCSATCAIEIDVCGNGLVEMGEDCDLGRMNVDRPAIEVAQGTNVFACDPVQRFTPATFFYALVSASSHTGFEESGLSNLFVYRDMNTGVLSLFIVHGIDFATTGVRQPRAQVDFDLTGFPAGTTLALSDDSAAEFGMSTATSYRGRWRFEDNTDGGLVNGLTLPGSWTITIAPSFVLGITRWRWVNESSFFTPFTLATNVTIRAYDTPSMCRRDCTVPRCGDGVLDGGEVCDDGNTRSGDRCRADCSSVLP
jgi:cysteine-rich repeat protein